MFSKERLMFMMLDVAGASQVVIENQIFMSSQCGPAWYSRSIAILKSKCSDQQNDDGKYH